MDARWFNSSRKDNDLWCGFCLYRSWKPVESLKKWGFQYGCNHLSLRKVYERLERFQSGGGVGWYVLSGRPSDVPGTTQRWTLINLNLKLNISHGRTRCKNGLKFNRKYFILIDSGHFHTIRVDALKNSAIMFKIACSEVSALFNFILTRFSYN